jgi:hypothetical protein
LAIEHRDAGGHILQEDLQEFLARLKPRLALAGGRFFGSRAFTAIRSDLFCRQAPSKMPAVRPGGRSRGNAFSMTNEETGGCSPR